MFILKIQNSLVRSSVMAFISLSTLVGLSTTSCAVGLSIKLDLSPNAKTKIITPIMNAGNLNTRNVQKTHVTIGFVENIPDQKTADEIGQIAQDFITQQGNLPIRFEVLNCQNLFGHITAIIPSVTSKNLLTNLNTALQTHLNTINIKGFIPTLSALTQPVNYTPHISLKSGTAAAHQINDMNKEIQNLRKAKKPAILFFNIKSATYRVM